MKSLAAFTLIMLVLAAPGAAQSTQTVRTVAVVDFVDESSEGLFIQASRLSEELVRMLAEKGAGRLRLIPVETVRAAMRERNVRPHELLGPNRTAEIAAAVGAEWIITGRWLHLDTDVERVPDVPGVHPRLSGTAFATLEIRVLDAATRRPVLTDSFGGVSPGASHFFLRLAAHQALLRAAERIARL